MTTTALRLAAVLAGVAFALLLVVTDLSGPIGNRSGRTAIELAIGLAVAVSGIALWLAGRSRLAGLLAVAVGVIWLGAVGAASRDASDVLRSPGLALDTLRSPALLALAVTIARVPRLSRPGALLAAALFSAAIVVAVLRVATYDPFADAACSGCGHVVPVLPVSPAGQEALRWLATEVAVLCALGLIVGAILALASRRRLAGAQIALVATASLTGVAAAAMATATLLRGPLSGQSVDEDTILALTVTLSGLLFAVALSWIAVDAIRVRVRLRQLADDVISATQPGGLRERLANALHDSSLELGYWLDGERRFVSALGLPLERSQDSPDGRITIERGGRPIAAIWRRNWVAGEEISAQLTPSVLLALDNERLQAEGLASLRALQASRARLVTVQDEERRRVERDLHDGIQQRALAMAFGLRLAGADGNGSTSVPASGWLARAEALAMTLVDEIRRLAHGIHPAVLSQAGLSAALSSLADEAPIPLEVSIDAALDLPDSTEAAVYQLVVDALAHAVGTGALEMSAAIDRAGTVVAVTIEFPASPTPLPARLVDRIAAAGGTLSLRNAAGATTTQIRAALPCA